MPTLEEVLSYLGIDYTDETVNRNVTRCIATADAYLKGSIGQNYPADDPRVKASTPQFMVRQILSIVSNDKYPFRFIRVIIFAENPACC